MAKLTFDIIMEQALRDEYANRRLMIKLENAVMEDTEISRQKSNQLVNRLLNIIDTHNEEKEQ